MRISVIMPVDRPGEDSRWAIESVLRQETSREFELIVVGTSSSAPADPRIKALAETDRNPAIRRNRAVAASSGDLLAFIDDDASADPRWLETAAAFLDAHPDVAVLGGPDPAPPDSTMGELVSDTLLATPLIGSGVLCHEAPAGIREVRSPHDLALVNLFVRRDAFEAAGGFDESIGYIGEDTALVASALTRGRAVYHSGVVVHHRRRAFPGAYLRQRWRYRVKTGVMMRRGGTYARNPKVLAFLAAVVAGLVTLAAVPLVGAALLATYALLTLVLGVRATRLPWYCWWLIPPAFALHHATYFLGIVYGLVRGRKN